MNHQFPLPQPLPQNCSTSTSNESNPRANVYRPNSVTHPPPPPTTTSFPKIILPQQKNVKFNRNDAHFRYLETSIRNSYLLYTRVNSVRQKNEQLEREIFSLRGMLNNTVPKEQYDELLKGKTTVAANNEKLVQNNEQLTNQNETFKQNIQDLETERNTLQVEYEQCKSQNKKKVSQLKLELKTVRENVKVLTDKNQELVKIETDKLQNSLNDSREEEKKLLQQVKNMEHEIFTLKNEQKQQSVTVAKYNEDAITLSNKLIEQDKRFQTLLREKTNVQQEFNTERERLQTKIEDMKGKAKKSNKKLEDKTAEFNKQLLQWNTQLQWKCDEVEEALAHQKNNDKKIALLNEENRNLEESLKRCKSESVQRQNDIERLSNEKAELEQKLQMQELKAAQGRRSCNIRSQPKVHEVITIDDDEEDVGLSPAKKPKRSVN